jgi:RsiW-degrading membrane proteinase PrsW (M82 family)
MAETITIQVIWTLFLTAVLPALLWLFFWLREDRFHPEPRGLLILTFLAGGLVVFLITPLEQLAVLLGIQGTPRILFFAAIEVSCSWFVLTLLI